MDKILQRLLAVEKKAAAIVEKAENEEKNMPTELSAELDNIRKERMERAKTRLAELTDEEEKRLSKSIKKIDDRNEAKIKKLKEIEESKREDWARAIFKKIIETEESGV